MLEEEVTCPDCGAEFTRLVTERWKVRCTDCWLDRKAARENREATTELRVEIGRLKREIRALKDNGIGKLRDHLTFLIHACHPDKNQARQKEAHEVTLLLLEIRKKVKEENNAEDVPF